MKTKHWMQTEEVYEWPSGYAKSSYLVTPTECLDGKQHCWERFKRYTEESTERLDIKSTSHPEGTKPTIAGRSQCHRFSAEICANCGMTKSIKEAEVPE